MKRKTKFFVTSLLTIAAVGVVATSCFIAFRNKPIYPLDTYILKFTHLEKNNSNIETNQKAGNESKNRYINEMINRTRTILDWYESYYKKTYGENFSGLIFDFTNLNSSQSEGEKNFFILLDRTLKAIDSRLGFNNIPRTPTSVQEGFYQKNTEMISYYWSPDFNAITTWLTYMFTDHFPIGNQWPKLYRLLEKPTEKWQESLKQTLVSKNLFHSPIEILNFSSKARAAASDSISQFYTLLSNTIGTWVVNNSQLTIEPSKVEGDVEGFYDVAKNPGDGIQFVNWITSQITNIPFVEDGPNSSTPFLIRSGYFNPNNPNADYNFRDWYYNRSTVDASTAQFRFWNKANPFDVNKTPFNPSFSNAPSSMFFNSTWTGLTSWTTVSDYYEIRNPQTKVGPSGTYLVSTGSKTSVSELENNYNETENSLTFKIRPIPWVDYTGKQINDDQGRPAFLSPADFTASIISFIRSNQISLNSNAYFIDLISLDTDKTVKHPMNLERNISSSDEKEFKLFFKEKPDISTHSILDILQKQYFCAVPAFKESVKNIIDYDRFKSLLPNVVEVSPSEYINGEFNLKVNSSAIDFYNFYGSGNPVLNSASWKDYAFASPYYISSIDQQQIVFNYNEEYFKSFSQQELNTREYSSFNNNVTILPTTENGNKETNIVAKIPKLVLKYSGSYSEILTYEQFKNNELDLSELSSAKLLEAKHQFPSDYRSQKIEKLNKSNLVSFNLQVYSKNSKSIILDENEKPITKVVDGKEVVAYDIDQYGNYVFPKNIKPKLKSNISKSYNDLIVKDYYTPIDAYDPANNIYAASATIRETIANCINWVALKSVVFPGITKSIQYSFMPYGVYDIGNPNDNKKYWWFAAYKPYMSDQLEILNENTYKNRKSGLMIWTYEELLNNSIKEGDK